MAQVIHERHARPSPRPGFSPWQFGLLLALLILAAFPQVIFGLETFVARDFGSFVYPLAHFQRACFWRGELPFWDPYNNCGVPFLAQWNTMPLYPPSLLYLTLPLQWSLSFFSLLAFVVRGFRHVLPRAPLDGQRLCRRVCGHGLCVQWFHAQPADVAQPHRDVQLAALGRAGGRKRLARGRQENSRSPPLPARCKCSPADRKPFFSPGSSCRRCGCNNSFRPERREPRCSGVIRWSSGSYLR